jgi:hypothetical protein
MSLLENDIKELLQQTLQDDIFIGDQPDAPNNVITIYRTGGSNPAHAFDRKEFEMPTFQIRVRSFRYENGMKKCNDIKDILDGVSEIFINDNRYLDIFQQGDILAIGKDSRKRHEFTINFECKMVRAEEIIFFHAPYHVTPGTRPRNDFN